MQIDWTAIGQGLAIIGIVGMSVIAGIKGHRRSDGTPPADRPPAPNEVKEVLGELRRTMDRIESSLNRHREVTGDDLSDLKKAVDRIEAAQRLQDALAGIRREYGGNNQR